MPRRRGNAAPARSAPSRPTTTQNRQVTPQQPPNRSSSTTTQPPAAAAPGAASQGAQAGRGPGLFGQMASTAAYVSSKLSELITIRWLGQHLWRANQVTNWSSGVAVGSSIGHAVGGWFGGSGAAPAEAQDSTVASQQTQDGGYQNNTWAQESCEPAANGLTTCLDQNNGNMQICTWLVQFVHPHP